jgi:hypothetical protein
MEAEQRRDGTNNTITSVPPGGQGNQPSPEVENRKDRLSNDLLQQKYRIIRWVTILIGSAILLLYSTFIFNIVRLFYTGAAYDDLPITTLVLIGMTGSIPTILSISMLVGIFSKESSKEEKSTAIDISTLAKVGGEILKYVRPH